jgi:hypothetical protein
MDNDKPTIKDRYNGLNTMQKVGVFGVGTAVVGTLLYMLFGVKEAMAASKTAETSTTKTEPSSNTNTTPGGSNATTPTTPADDVIEPIYSLPNALALHLDKLPLLRPQFGSTPGSRFFVLAADSDEAKSKLLADVVNNLIAQQGVMTGNAIDRTPDSMPGGRFVSDFSATTALRGAVSPPVDLMFIVLGDQENVSVGAMKESLARMRAKMPAQRILWVLSPSTPPSIAKALNESKEEWIVSPDGSKNVPPGSNANSSKIAAMTAIADAAWKAATVNQAGDLATTFPAVGTFTPYGI